MVQFLDGNRDTPLNLILTGRLANRFREFFVHVALWVIQAQRVAPWVFAWPGKNKLRGVGVPAPGAAAHIPGRAESALQVER